MALKFPGQAIRVNETDVSIVVILRKTADATAETGIAAASVTGATYWRFLASSTTAVTGLSDLAALNTAHADGGWKEIGDGAYRLDIQDAAFADGVDAVLVTVKTAASLFHQLFPLTYDGMVRTFVPQAFDATTVTFDSGASATDDTYNALVVEILDSDVAADKGAQAFVTDYVGATKVATIGNGWEGRTPTGTAANLVAVCYSSVPLVRSLWRELSRSGSTLTFKYDNADTAQTKTETRAAGLDSLVGLS